MAKIICNNPGLLTGQVGSIRFVAGEGETEDAAMLAYFAEHPDRFDVIESDHEDEHEDGGAPEGQPVPNPASDPDPEATDYDALSVAELRKLAKANGVTQAGDKAELIARIKGTDNNGE